MHEITIKRLKKALGLKREIIGVKIIQTEKEYNLEKAIELSGKYSICNLVSKAEKGVCIKANKQHIGCVEGGMTLGILDGTRAEKDNSVLLASGLYDNLDIVNKVKTSMCNQNKNYGIIISPLEKMQQADIVILIINSRQAMRIIQGYSYWYGMNASLKTVGNQAICSDLISKPFTNHNMNVSFMCRGTRASLNASDDELGISLPLEQFDKMVSGVIKTLSLVENETQKEKILSSLNDPLELGQKIEMDTSYMKRMQNRIEELEL